MGQQYRLTADFTVDAATSAVQGSFSITAVSPPPVPPVPPPPVPPGRGGCMRQEEDDCATLPRHPPGTRDRLRGLRRRANDAGPAGAGHLPRYVGRWAEPHNDAPPGTDAAYRYADDGRDFPIEEAVDLFLSPEIPDWVRPSA